MKLVIIDPGSGNLASVLRAFQKVAAEAGIGPGVLIRKVGKTAVKTIGDFAEAIEKESPVEGVVLQVRTPRGNSVILLKKGL